MHVFRFWFLNISYAYFAAFNLRVLTAWEYAPVVAWGTYLPFFAWFYLKNRDHFKVAATSKNARWVFCIFEAIWAVSA